MGRYIEWDDLISRYPSVNAIGGAEEIGSAYLSYAEAEVDGRLASHFTVPFSSNNATVRDLVLDLAYSRVGNLKFEAAKELRDLVYDKIKLLKQGSMAMVTDSGSAIQTIGGTIFSTAAGYTPVFDIGPEEGWVVDSDQLRDIADAKR